MFREMMVAYEGSDHHEEDDDDDDEQPQDWKGNPQDAPESEVLLSPLLSSEVSSTAPTPSIKNLFRSRKQNTKRKRRKRSGSYHSSTTAHSSSRKGPASLAQCLLRLCCNNAGAIKSTLNCMNVMARIVFWGTVVALAAAVVWYSLELFHHGKEPHLIAWFSAGAFVLLGFPISMWGIVTHLANYNQPNIQVYIVRILWMVPIYSIESWLAMRFHKQAIYIETLRDFYESYVLYSFLQFLIQVLGGEEALILMLKDKSPTRGVHMWGLQWCVKPWLMGQPIRRTVYERDDESGRRRAIKRIHWTSPFFVKCKFGVLQYVLLKFLSAIAVLLLEWKGVYKEGDFTWKGGYLYICFLTNLSQCWALYCLIFFYYATHTELSPIRPVGKFLSVKALVFFTWWQSLIISIFNYYNMIPHYSAKEHDWTSEDVAKGIQDYLICMEMFLAAVVHTFVFPHSEYSPPAVEARTRALNHTTPMKWHKKRLGRHKTSYVRDDASKSSGVEMVSLDGTGSYQTAETWEEPTHLAGQVDAPDSPLPWDDQTDNRRLEPVDDVMEEQEEDDDEEEEGSSGGYSADDAYVSEEEQRPIKRPGFVRALLDSAIPLDLTDNTVGILKGDYVVERKTLLHHAVTSDQYDLFSNLRQFKAKHPKEDASMER